MKRFVILFFTISFSLLLTACDPGSYMFDYDELTNNVIRVELIDYKNPDQKHFVSWVPDHSSKLLPFNTSDLTTLEALDENKIPDFLSQLSEENILYKYYAYDSPKGICLKLSYSNGDFLIISCDYERKSYSGYIGIYSADGNIIDFIGCFSNYYSFETLVNDFFETDLPII